MYLNLRKEMIKNGVKWKNISELLGKGNATIHNKFIKQTCKVDIREAKQIRDEFFPDLTLDYLFKVE